MLERGLTRLMELAEVTQGQTDKVCVSRKTLEAVLQQCQLALQQLASGRDNNDNNDICGELNNSPSPDGSTDDTCSITSCNTDKTKLYSILKSTIECDYFLKKLENHQASLPRNIADEGSSWDMVSKNDLWGGRNAEAEMEDYVVVQQEDIVEGIASFMVAYLLSMEQTKDLSPNQLHQALNKTFSVKMKKSKLRKAWDGSRVIYNVASWGATAVGIYQNPALLEVASTALQTSCRVITNLL